MGCGISRFEQDHEADHQLNPLPFDADHHDRYHSQLAKNIIARKTISRPSQKKFASKSLLANSPNSCSEDLEIKTTRPRKKEETAEKNSNDGGENGEHEDVDPIDNEEREDGFKFRGSPSFREYCNSEIGSRSIGRRKTNYVNVEEERKMFMSHMDQPPHDHVNKGSVGQTVKKESSLLRRMLARSRQARKYSLLK